jgi:hypothetical protein
MKSLVIFLGHFFSSSFLCFLFLVFRLEIPLFN